MTAAFRNPLQFVAIIAMGIIQSFLLISLYHGVGEVDFHKVHIKEIEGEVRKVIGNWLGMVFLAASD